MPYQRRTCRKAPSTLPSNIHDIIARAVLAGTIPVSGGQEPLQKTADQSTHPEQLSQLSANGTIETPVQSSGSNIPSDENKASTVILSDLKHQTGTNTVSQQTDNSKQPYPATTAVESQVRTST
ncbi:hypothetical protein GLAREA_07985 [Glarea lozoyensis ATCC 20868]|uniref:Uncharacterized protein n=1 Tax=Glarea lozoyensis (strain ATCC 20868 / MF5171) TaxID=1116229 RepID=S3CDP4_GLAL2|nr:uncharacterized protein GLAREA_07985 [Glarea lozoyensis ATCC 20868]EPE24135.1 hypothetical protein GLAREA_07985 [Glarea lozoyensis ATCC 20868]